MSWFGKIVGGGLGMAFGGPLGALIGASLGHAIFDSQVGGSGTGRLSSQEAKQAVFFTTTFAMLGKMAKADGKVSPEEIALVETVMRDRLGLDTRARRFAITLFNEAKDDPTPFSAYAGQFGQVFADTPQARQMLFQILFDLALADGEIHPAEDRLLRGALGPLGLDARFYEELRGRTAPDLAAQYAVLGVDPDVTEAELKRAYRKLVQDYHPDKIISKGLPEEFTKFAEQKFKEINGAYETILEHRKK